jgi:hypothetical protein
MSRRDIQLDRAVAELQLVSITDRYIALRRPPPQSIVELQGRLLELTPIDVGYNHTRVILLHDVSRTSIVITMRVTDDEELNLCWIEPDLAHPTSDDAFRFIVVVEGVDEDDPFRCRNGPGRNKFRSEEMDIVEDFHWLGRHLVTD